jgi:hypothetical protein
MAKGALRALVTAEATRIALNRGIQVPILEIVQEVVAMDTPQIGYDIEIVGLSKEELTALSDKVKSAIVLVLPERVKLGQVLVSPKFKEA